MITPPAFLKLYREWNRPETVDDFVAVYDLQALFGSANPLDVCTETSGCFFRSEMRCEYDVNLNSLPGDGGQSCSTIFDDPYKPAIFILRSEYERALSG